MDGLGSVVASIMAVRVTGDGRREVLGLDIGPSEAETFCIAFLHKLARRGLRGLKLVISDAREGLKAAITPRSCTPPGSAAACTSRATLSPMLGDVRLASLRSRTASRKLVTLFEPW
jgi:Transposase, Mutator family